MNALQQSELDELEKTERTRFRIESTEQVNWALRKLAALETKQTEVMQLAAQEVSRIFEWEKKELSSLQDDKAFFESSLAEYAQAQRAMDPKYKKTSTPYGAIKYVKQQPQWTYDDAKLVESLKAAGRDDLVRIKEEPDKPAIKKLIVDNGNVVDPETGAMIEGVTVLERPDKVVIDL